MIVYRALSKPSAFCFDLDDTLYDNGPIIRRATTRLNTYLAEQHPEIAVLAKRQWQSIRRETVAEDPRLASDMSRLRMIILAKLAAEIGYSTAQQQHVANEGYALFYQTRSDFKVDKNIYSLLEKLSESRPLVAITNGNVDLARVGIAGLFSCVLQANIDAPMKPSPFMFERALEHLKLPATSIMHVGDHLVKDVWAAHQLGFQTAWYACNREMQLQREPVRVLPSVQLATLTELLGLID